MSIVYRFQRWAEIRHYGRSGSDDGIDIFASDLLENGKRRTWAIQCKRYLDISLSEIKKAIDKVVGKNEVQPDMFLLITSSNLRKEKIEKTVEYAVGEGFQTATVITGSVLEAELYSRHHDLLFAYFGINLTQKQNGKVSAIRRRIDLKQRIQRELRARFDPTKVTRAGDNIKYNNFLIRSIDDSSYPEVDQQRIGISGWFKVEPFDFYHNGIAVILSIANVIHDESGHWDLEKYSKVGIDNSSPQKTKCFVVGRIPYDNIVAYDVDGDEYYNFPHFFCDFSIHGEPYEEILYFPIAESGPDNMWQALDNSMRVQE